MMMDLGWVSKEAISFVGLIVIKVMSFGLVNGICIILKKYFV